MTTDCIFCNIINGRTDTKFLFENEALVVFKDINPHAPEHLLVVPKKHIRSINDLDAADRAIIAEITDVARQMAACPGFGALTAFEVKGLDAFQQGFFVAKLGGGQLVEVAAVRFLLIG